MRELEDLPKWLGTFVRNTFGMSAVDKMKWYVFIGCTIHMPLSNAITQVWGCKVRGALAHGKKTRACCCGVKAAT